MTDDSEFATPSRADAPSAKTDAARPATEQFATSGLEEKSPTAKSPKKARPFWQELIILCVVALVIAWFVKAFFIQSFYVPSESMMPTLIGHTHGNAPDDRLLVQKVSYWSGGPDRGDVVVFKDPGGWLSDAETPDPNAFQRAMEVVGLYPTGGHLVKRVIGVGGDHVQCCDSKGRLQINGESIDEPYVKNPAATKAREFDVTVPDGKLWVMGDNRAHSADSVYHMDEKAGGFVDEDLVVGKVWSVVWPLDRFGGLPDVGDIGDLDD
ncbi:signal peptidase I [Solicola gregarius]|uniref:Signal peptidase I n=1 Tax=Solicola gregarius TaxID=2908642 RepID=A0AA46TFL5_9ACTN|nr:signal peptidase I [Solicola gregarius]UYM04411.1 signal peptidase I [Solicola gregarius]